MSRIGHASRLRVQCLPYRAVKSEEGLARYFPATDEDANSPDIELALPVYRGGTSMGLLTRERLIVPQVRDRVLNEGAAFVRPNGFSSDHAASIWDALVQGPGQHVVLHWLRMLDHNIEDLVYIDGKRAGRLALLKIQGKGRIPLRSMGDGLTK